MTRRRGGGQCEEGKAAEELKRRKRGGGGSGTQSGVESGRRRRSLRRRGEGAAPDAELVRGAGPWGGAEKGPRRPSSWNTVGAHRTRAGKRPQRQGGTRATESGPVRLGRKRKGPIRACGRNRNEGRRWLVSGSDKGKIVQNVR